MRSSSLRALLVAGALAVAAPISVSAATVNAWTNVGPEGGALLELVHAGGDPGVAYARTKHDVYRSADGGATWTRLAFTTAGEVADLAVASAAPQKLFIVTRPATGSTTQWRVLRSTDGGQSFSDLPFPNRDGISALAVSADGQRVYMVGGVFGVQRSVDGGNTFNSASTGFPTSVFQPAFFDTVDQLVVSPTAPSSVFAETSTRSIWRTTDGSSWTALGNGIPSGNHVVYHADIAFDPVVATRIYALANNLAYVSNDSGANWTAVPCCDGTQAAAIRAAADGSIVVAASDGRVLRSADGGASWDEIAAGRPPATRLALAADDAQRVLAATPHGVDRTADGGTSWQASDGLRAGLVVGLARSPDDADLLLAASPTLGVLRSTDGGATWGPANAGIPSRAAGINACDVAFDADDAGRAYAYVTASTQGADLGLFRSDDDGASWTKVVGDYIGNCRSLTTVAGSPDEVRLQASSGLYRSLDGGATWTLVLIPGGGGFSTSSVVPSQPLLMLGGNNDGVHLSADGGASFTTLLSSGQHGFPNDVAFDPTDPQRLYAVTTLSGLVRSSDGGATWTAGNPLGAMSGTSLGADIVVNPDRPNELVVGSVTGVWRSSNHGADWERIERGSGAAQIAVDARGAVLVLGAADEGSTLLAGAAGATNPGLFRVELGADLGVAYAGEDAFAVGAPMTASFSVSRVSGYAPTGFNATITIDPPLPGTAVTMTGAACGGGAGSYTCTSDGLPTGLINVAAAPTAIGAHVITVEVGSDLADPVGANDAVEVEVAVQTGADLRLTATQPTVKKRRGDKLKYVVTVTNDGPAAATGVLLDANVPSNLNFLSATLDGAACVRTGAAVRCTKASLAPGTSTVATLTFKARAKGIATFSASATSDVPDPDAADATRTLTKQIYK